MIDICLLPLALVRAPSWAKAPDPPIVERIAEQFDPRMAGFLIVSQRSPTDFVVIDGMVRWEALLRLDATWWPCFVHTGLTEQREVEIRMALCRPGADV
jgi:hypothetical protein